MNHFAQVKKAVCSYVGFEPTTFRLRDDRSTNELVCKLSKLGREVFVLQLVRNRVVPHELKKLVTCSSTI